MWLNSSESTQSLSESVIDCSAHTFVFSVEFGHVWNSRGSSKSHFPFLLSNWVWMTESVVGCTHEMRKQCGLDSLCVFLSHCTINYPPPTPHVLLPSQPLFRGAFVQVSPAMFGEADFVIITAQAGMEKAPRTFYKGPQALRAIFSVRGLSPLLQHLIWSEWLQRTALWFWTISSQLEPTARPACQFWFTEASHNVCSQALSWRNTIIMLPLCNYCAHSGFYAFQIRCKKHLFSHFKIIL